ncbi:response regulator transcription factor [Roseinatronobacter sp.]
MKVLLVESNTHTAATVQNALKLSGQNVTTSQNSEEAIYMMAHFDFDAIILNEELDDMTGIQTVRKARLMGIRTPIIVFTLKNSSSITVETLVAGADDYLLYPLQSDEIGARIEAVVRRSRGISSSVVKISNLTVDVHGQCASVEGKPVNLTKKEYEILEALVVRKGRPVDKESLMNIIYGHEDEPNIKIIDVFICKLRKKLEALMGGEQIIETIWGRGYMIRNHDKPSHTTNAIPSGRRYEKEHELQLDAPWMVAEDLKFAQLHIQ